MLNLIDGTQHFVKTCMLTDTFLCISHKLNTLNLHTINQILKIKRYKEIVQSKEKE